MGRKAKTKQDKRQWCPWCSRTDVRVTAKEQYAPHVNADGNKCLGTGQGLALQALGPKKSQGGNT